MLRLLDDVVAELAIRGVPFALIGAGAMAAHGVGRSTADLDLLCVDRSVLEPAFWAGLGPGRAADVRRGDEDDPLAGVVRLSAPGERPVDLVVGRPAWMHRVLARATRSTIGRTAVPVAGLVDLVLLKLYAGGPQDAWDVEQLLAAGGRETVAAEVQRGLEELPAEAARLWAVILDRGAR